MKEKDKKSKRELSGFLKYMKKEMTGRESNAFEKALQKDPFSEEASEGLETITPEQIRSDMRRLNENLSVRSGRRRITPLYRVAASLLIIIAAGSLIIISTRKSGTIDENIAVNNKLSEPSDTYKLDTEPVANTVKSQALEEKASPPPQKKEKEVISDEIIAAPAEEIISAEPLKAVKAEALTDTSFELKVLEDAYISGNNKARAVAVPSALASDIRKSEALIRGRIISSEDNLPLPGVTVQIKGTTIGTVTDVNGNFSFPAESAAGQALVASYIGMKPGEFVAKSNDFNEIKLDPDINALEEIVVVGYGTARKSEAAGAATRIDMTEKTSYSKYIPPEPESGREAYDKYIEESIRKPVEFNEGDRIVVIVSFIVTSNGTIDSLRVLRSGGESFSGEAMRLIKEGPSWKPATENGKKIDDEVRIRIVFK